MESSEDRPAVVRYQFGLRDMLIGVTVIGLLLALIVPSIEASRESARRNSCFSNMKQLVLAFHNYHDVWHQFPNLSTTQIRGIVPASSATDPSLAAGYSWQVKILPFQCEVTLYQKISQSSNKFALGPFDPTVRKSIAALGPSNNLFTTGVLYYQCPSYTGSPFSDSPEYIQTVGLNGIAISNYTALSATHLDCILGDPQSPGYLPPNGILVPGPTKVVLKDVKDGTSKTLMLCETREPGYASWLDGTVGWAVGADCNSLAPAIDNFGLMKTSYGNTLNVGPSKANAKTSYLPARIHKSIATDWRWGPSSQHTGGIVVHGIADGSARGISDDIDPTLYLQLITRDGREPIGACCD